MEKVKAYSASIKIPTYETGKPNRLPMFFDKRVYQGSSGKVYPLNVIENISDVKTDKEYNAVFLENEYLLIMILPEIGGRIQRILDKTNKYDAVYYNEVIKPALVGLAGPWISGGIEFNWPQHHRPSTFSPVDYTISENEDGSATVWVSEIERMSHTKGMAGFTLYPGKAYLEVKGQIYNQTEMYQTFLWWANPAIPVNNSTQSIFPPDVHAVMDHGKRDVSKFPIATGFYYNVDYSEGVDISRYKNIPVPTSYMAYHSDYDFIGNYDYEKNAGLLHIADHHISPGKKQWTWGCEDFGEAWYRNLTDDNGPYIELMTGVFTDNQPDFTYLAPLEEKTFTQYFMPYKNVGAVKNATLDAMINLEIKDSKAHIYVYAPAPIKASIVLTGGPLTKYLRETAELNPENPYEKIIDLESEDIEDTTRLTLSVRDSDDNILVSYSPLPEVIEKLPDPAKEAKPPEEIASLEELFLTAQHLEQYRHATRSPIPYYLEGLKRDSSDIRLNNGYGKLLYKKGLFKEAEEHFRKAIERSTLKNPNPYDCEPFYNLGLALKKQKRYDEAYDAFYKSIWSSAMQDKGFYQLACICARRNDYKKALEFTEQSLLKGYHNLRSRNLKTALLRLLERRDEAAAFAEETKRIDPLDTGCRYELYRIRNDFHELNEMTRVMHAHLHNYIELSLNYADAGLYKEAAKVLALISQAERPMLHYYMAYYSNSDVELQIAAKCRDFLFPNLLTDMIVLENAINNNPEDSLAPYLLGCLLYDKERFDDAIDYWEMSKTIDPKNPDVYRNLAIAYYNKRKDPEQAMHNMERALRLDSKNARIFYEYDQLCKLMNVAPKKRLKTMTANMELVNQRDDLYTEYVTLLNTCRYFRRALKAMEIHRFHPWEGGEGKITAQYRRACIGIGMECLRSNDNEGALKILQKALIYPENLGEGKLPTATDNDIYYFLGCAYKNIDLIDANECFNLALRITENLDSQKYYSDQPPEMFFYSAKAAEQLGYHKLAIRRYRKLINYYETHFDNHCEIDYFAVSLPDFLIFDADLDKNNFVHCCYMAALGYIGMGDEEKAVKFAEMGLEKNASHQGLTDIRDMNEEPVENSGVDIEGGYFKAASWQK